MTLPLPPENGPEPRSEQLQDLLRAAVEQVRQEPVPEPRLHRALVRARRLRRQPPSSRFQRVQLILALTTLAAVLLLSLMFLMHLALLPPEEVKGPPPTKKPKPTPKGDGSIDWLGRGLDPKVPTTFDASRIEDVAIRGVVAPKGAVGIAGAPPDSGRLRRPDRLPCRSRVSTMGKSGPRAERSRASTRPRRQASQVEKTVLATPVKAGERVRCEQSRLAFTFT